MKEIRLMNRTDTKFVTTMPRLLELLSMAASEYFVQEIDGKRIASYYTLYFDSSDCMLFHMHQSGHLNRQKLRIRTYLDSGINFLEIKTKNNKKRTSKKRVSMDGFDPEEHGCGSLPLDQEQYHGFMERYLHFSPDLFAPRLENNFERITLVNYAKTERLTIDTHLVFHNLSTGRDFEFTDLVIIELKRNGLEYSPILNMLRALHIKPMSYSKYCMGLALTDPSLRINRFKPRLHALRRLSSLPIDY